MALGLTWGGFADTGIQFSSFYKSDHTLAIRFLRRYPHAYAGPFLTVGGGGRSGMYFAGQGDFNVLPPGYPTTPLRLTGLPHLIVAIGSETRWIGLGADVDWHHLALVARGNDIEIFVDGKKKVEMPKSKTAPVGTLWLGRTEDATPEGRGGQFVGLLDDFALFDSALKAKDVEDLAEARRLSGREKTLVVGHTFGYEPPNGMTRELSHPLPHRSPGAQIEAVSDNRMGLADISKVPLPLNAHMRLPFAPGSEWRVIQGFDDPGGSHHGYAAFCWDFGCESDGTRGQPFYSCAPGPVAGVKEDSTDKSKQANFVVIQHRDGSFCDYLHQEKDSAPVKMGDRVSYGEKLGTVGDTGNAKGPHLHMAVTNNGEHVKGSNFHTIPVAFSNYEVRDKDGDWKRLIRGIPTKGQHIRFPAKRGPLKFAAVWVPGNAREVQVYNWRYIDYAAKQAQLQADDWRLAMLGTTAVGGDIRFTAVWRRGDDDDHHAYFLTKQQFESKHKEEAREGRRLELLTAARDSDGDSRFFGVWRKGAGAGDQKLHLDLLRAQWQETAKELRGGMHPQCIASHPGNGGIDRYSAVWNEGKRDWKMALARTQDELRADYDRLWKDGWRLRHLTACETLTGDLYSAYWSQEGGSETQVYDWEYEDTRARYDVLWEQGWRLKILAPFNA